VWRGLTPPLTDRSAPATTGPLCDPLSTGSTTRATPTTTAPPAKSAADTTRLTRTCQAGQRSWRSNRSCGIEEGGRSTRVRGERRTQAGLATDAVESDSLRRFEPADVRDLILLQGERG
jgi:hypothetical protein